MLDDALARSLFAVAIDDSVQSLAVKLVMGVEATEDEYDRALVSLSVLKKRASADSDVWIELNELEQRLERRRVQGQIAFDIHRLDSFVEEGWICGDGFALLQDYLGYDDSKTPSSVRSTAQSWLQASAEHYDDDTPNDDMFGWQEIVRAAACLCTDRSWIWRIAGLPLLREKLNHFCPIGLSNALSVSLDIRNSFPKDWIVRFDAGVLHASMYNTRNEDHGVLRIGHAVDCAMSVASMFDGDDVIIRQIVETAIFAVEQEIIREQS